MDSWVDYRRRIDQILDEDRPERASVGDQSWRHRAYGWARNHIPDEEHLVRHFAEQEVDRREREATKAGNAIIRRWLHGQAPLDWALLGPKPIKVDELLRVRLDAATPDDIEDSARLLETKGKAQYDEVIALANGMRDLARAARRAGHAYVALLGNQDPCAPGEERIRPWMPDDDFDDFLEGDEDE